MLACPKEVIIYISQLLVQSCDQGMGQVTCLVLIAWGKTLYAHQVFSRQAVWRVLANGSAHNVLCW